MMRMNVILLIVALGAHSVASDSCLGRCLDKLDPNFTCQCNDDCYNYGDCCGDIEVHCDFMNTCVGRTCNTYYFGYPCQCNDECLQYGNCCSDRYDVCVSPFESCSGRCDSNYDASLDCQCNAECPNYGNCCSDFDTVCGSGGTGGSTTCSGRCDQDYDASQSCQCDAGCGDDGDCCSDYTDLCESTAAPSCTGRCGQTHDSSQSCQCNDACVNFDDCCGDYSSVCSSGGTGGNGGTGGTGDCAWISSTNAELETVSRALWELDDNSVPESEVQYDLQGKTTQSATGDVAPNLFYVSVNASRFNYGTYKLLRDLQDNYIRTQGYTEVVTEQELQENSDFLDAVLSTAVGQKLFEFLDSKNLAGCSGIEGFKVILNDIWFGMYDRKAPDDTSGFEHAFVGEIKGTGVSGFHNWMYFYEQEQSGEFNYQGYLSNQTPRMVGMRHTWYGATKPINGFTIGTSPEIEFALYSLCHLSRPNSRCPISLVDSAGSTVFRQIQTYTWSAEAAPNGQSYIASAYFLT